MMHTLFLGVELAPPAKKFATEFIIDIDDRSNAYLSSLLTTINGYSELDRKITSGIKYGDSLLFNTSGVNLLTESEDSLHYLYQTKRIGIVAKYTDAIDHVKNFFKNVYVAPKKVTTTYFCPFSCVAQEKPKEVTVLDLLNGILNIKSEPKTPSKIYDGDRISVKEKVSIFNNFVKVGYEVYSIHTIRGDEYVVIGDITYEVNRTCFGKDYLTKV